MADNQTVFKLHFERETTHLINAHQRSTTIFGNDGHRGAGFENEVRDVLQRNMASGAYVGTGEIIHSETESRRKSDQNQLDIIVHNSKYPRIPVAGGIDLFMIETAIAFGEIKGKLEKKHIEKFGNVVHKIQSYPTTVQNDIGVHGAPLGEPQLRPYSFMIAADSSAESVTDIYHWMVEINNSDPLYAVNDLVNVIPKTNAKMTNEEFIKQDRRYFNHKFIDGVFVLNKGFVVLDSWPFNSICHADDANITNEYVWIYSEHNVLGTLLETLQHVYLHYYLSIFDFGLYLGSFWRNAEKNQWPPEINEGDQHQLDLPFDWSETNEINYPKK